MTFVTNLSMGVQALGVSFVPFDLLSASPNSVGQDEVKVPLDEMIHDEGPEPTFKLEPQVTHPVLFPCPFIVEQAEDVVHTQPWSFLELSAGHMANSLASNPHGFILSGTGANGQDIKRNGVGDHTPLGGTNGGDDPDDLHGSLEKYLDSLPSLDRIPETLLGAWSLVEDQRDFLDQLGTKLFENQFLGLSWEHKRKIAIYLDRAKNGYIPVSVVADVMATLLALHYAGKIPGVRILLRGAEALIQPFDGSKMNDDDQALLESVRQRIPETMVKGVSETVLEISYTIANYATLGENELLGTNEPLKKIFEMLETINDFSFSLMYTNGTNVTLRVPTPSFLMSMVQETYANLSPPHWFYAMGEVPMDEVNRLHGKELNVLALPLEPIHLAEAGGLVHPFWFYLHDLAHGFIAAKVSPEIRTQSVWLYQVLSQLDPLLAKLPVVDQMKEILNDLYSFEPHADYDIPDALVPLEKAIKHAAREADWKALKQLGGLARQFQNAIVFNEHGLIIPESFHHDLDILILTIQENAKNPLRIPGDDEKCELSRFPVQAFKKKASYPDSLKDMMNDLVLLTGSESHEIPMLYLDGLYQSLNSSGAPLYQRLRDYYDLRRAARVLAALFPYLKPNHFEILGRYQQEPHFMGTLFSLALSVRSDISRLLEVFDEIVRLQMLLGPKYIGLDLPLRAIQARYDDAQLGGVDLDAIHTLNVLKALNDNPSVKSIYPLFDPRVQRESSFFVVASENGFEVIMTRFFDPESAGRKPFMDFLTDQQEEFAAFLARAPIPNQGSGGALTRSFHVGVPLPEGRDYERLAKIWLDQLAPHWNAAIRFDDMVVHYNQLDDDPRQPMASQKSRSILSLERQQPVPFITENDPLSGDEFRATDEDFKKMGHRILEGAIICRTYGTRAFFGMGSHTTYDLHEDPKMEEYRITYNDGDQIHTYPDLQTALSTLGLTEENLTSEIWKKRYPLKEGMLELEYSVTEKKATSRDSSYTAENVENVDAWKIMVGRVFISQALKELKEAGITLNSNQLYHDKYGDHRLQQISARKEGHVLVVGTSVSRCMKRYENPLDMIYQAHHFLEMQVALTKYKIKEVRTARIYEINGDYLEREFVPRRLKEITLEDEQKEIEKKIRRVLEDSFLRGSRMNDVKSILNHALQSMSNPLLSGGNVGVDHDGNLVIYDF